MLPMQGARVQSLVRELDPTCMPQLRNPPAATKTWCNQINIKKIIIIKISQKRFNFVHIKDK